MDPLTMMALGSTALTAIGKLATGFAGSSLAQLQQSVADTNTKLLNQKAAAEEEEAQLPFAEAGLEQSRTVLQIQRTLGGETGGFTARNLDPTYGSPLLLERYTAGQGATDVALIGAKAGLSSASALLTAAGTRAQAAGSAGQAMGFSAQQTQDVLSGIFGAAGSTFSMLGSPSNPGNWNNLLTMSKSIGSGFSSTMSSLNSMVAG